MKKLHNILFLLFMLLMAACSKEDEGPAPTRITFTTDIQTRATGVSVMSNFKDGDAMHIFRSSSNSDANDRLVTYRATYNNSTWAVSPIATIRGKEKFYFFATYPASKSTSAIDPLAIPIDVTAQTDYLYSGSGVMATESQPTVAFQMHHAMAVIAFNIQSYVGGKLTAIKIGNDKFPSKGELRVTNGRTTPTAYGAYTKNFDLSLTSTGWTSNHPAIFAIPHQIGVEGLPVELTIDGQVYTVNIPAMQLLQAYKYVIYIVRTAQGVTLQADKTEAIHLMDTTQEIADISYGHISIRHNQSVFTMPTISGSQHYGIIYWGDGSQNDYPATTPHTYSSAGSYEVGIDLWNVESAKVTFPNLEGLEEINLSKF